MEVYIKKWVGWLTKNLGEGIVITEPLVLHIDEPDDI